MIQHGVFAVAEHAITTASATSANEARSRALALYRKWQKSVRILHRHVFHSRIISVQM
jgi:NADH dehydrogenase (ubiquinone) 1 alpha subcomplex subunit 6